MFCPVCGQERLSTETSFCSRCGFLLTGTAELIKAGGLIANDNLKKRFSKLRSNRGFKQGLFIMLLALLVVPIATVLAIVFRAGPFVPLLSMFLLVIGGLLRMIYALMFESAPQVQDAGKPILPGSMGQQALPPQQSIPVSSYGPPSAGRWRDTNDLEPASVIENTTKLFDKEK